MVRGRTTGRKGSSTGRMHKNATKGFTTSSKGRVSRGGIYHGIRGRGK